MNGRTVSFTAGARVGVLLGRLDGVRGTGKGRWIARCPAHADRSPSLSIAEGNDGRALLHCFAGCPAAEVLAAVSLTFSDLYPERAIGNHLQRKRPAIAPADVLAALEFRLLTLAIVVAQAIDGRPVDRDALNHALHEIGAIVAEIRYAA